MLVYCTRKLSVRSEVAKKGLSLLLACTRGVAPLRLTVTSTANRQMSGDNI